MELAATTPNMQRRDFLRKTGLAAAAGLGCRRPLADLLSRVGAARPGFATGSLYGSAVIAREIRAGSPFIPLITKVCRVITPNGQMHWVTTRPSPDSFDFTLGDQAIAFAKEHGMLVRGHALVYHNMTAPWLQPVITPRNAESLLTTHIRGVVSHFAGSMHSWDVVNEVAWPTDRKPGGLRNSFWYQNLGPDYVPLAFRTARASDPKVLLGYNEDGLEDDSRDADSKRSVVLKLLEGWLAAGVPIDYLGVQSHLVAGRSYSDAKLGRFLREARGLGLRVFITELDVNDRALPSDISRRDAAVADLYDSYLGIALGAVEIPVVETWGFTDVNSWLQGYAPRVDGLPQRSLPFDPQLRPTPTWDVIRRRLGIA